MGRPLITSTGHLQTLEITGADITEPVPGRCYHTGASANLKGLDGASKFSPGAVGTTWEFSSRGTGRTPKPLGAAGIAEQRPPRKKAWWHPKQAALSFIASCERL